MLFLTYSNIFKKEISYSDDTVQSIELPAKKLYMYIEVDFNQANTKYSKSISYPQLKGETKDLDATEPLTKKGYKVYYPAGEVANSYFQDNITLETLNIKQTKLTFHVDLKRIGITKYSPDEIIIPPKWTENTNKGTKALNFEGEPNGLPILNERFINWISISIFSPTKKLWGVVDVKEQKKYVLNVESISDYKKKIVFTTNSWLGFQNFWLPVFFLLISLLCLITSIILFQM